MTGNDWARMFEQRRGDGAGGAPPMPPLEEPPDDALELDPTTYRPWLLQRVKTRPAMMLHLRRFEARSGLWTGWALPYPNLYAIEYTGDRMLSLDFGVRQFMVQGEGLDQLLGPLQLGKVLALHEYSAQVWPSRPGGPLISSIHRVAAQGRYPAADG
jgi:hypothetical protein